MKKHIKNTLHKMGVYDTARKIIIKFYYPYRNYKIRKNAKEILQKVHNVVSNNAEDFWLDYGTLLGYVREGKIIKGDLDLDFGVIANGTLEKEFAKEGIYISQRILVEGVVTAEQYIYKNIGFDIFYYRYNEQGKIVTNVWLTDDRTVPQRISYEQGGGELGETVFDFEGTEEVVFYSVPFRIPKNSDRYLSEHYGSEYMIPNPNFTHKDEKNRIVVKKDFKVEFYG